MTIQMRYFLIQDNGKPNIYNLYYLDGLLLLPQGQNLQQNVWSKYLCLSENCLCPKLAHEY